MSPTVPVRVKGRFTSMKLMNGLSNLGKLNKKGRGAIYKRAKSNRHRTDIENFGRQLRVAFQSSIMNCVVDLFLSIYLES